jgi:hypothetical protein
MLSNYNDPPGFILPETEPSHLYLRRQCRRQGSPVSRYFISLDKANMLAADNPSAVRLFLGMGFEATLGSYPRHPWANWSLSSPLNFANFAKKRCKITPLPHDSGGSILSKSIFPAWEVIPNMHENPIITRILQLNAFSPPLVPGYLISGIDPRCLGPTIPRNPKKRVFRLNRETSRRFAPGKPVA